MHLTFDRTMEIITTIGTVGPFIWTVILYRSELKRRRLAEASERRHQATQITGWIEPRLGITNMPNRGMIVIHNNSPLPARSVQLHIIDFEGDVIVENLGFVPPGAMIENTPENFGISLRYPAEVMPLAFSFADAEGNHWFRDWEGGLREWTAEKNPDWYMPMVELWRPAWTPSRD